MPVTSEIFSFAFISCVFLVLYSLFFLSGKFHNKPKKKNFIFGGFIFDPDIIWGRVNQSVILNADLLAFWTVISLIPLIIIFCLFAGLIQNEFVFTAGIVFLLAVVGPWFVRGTYIFRNRHKTKVGKIWPNRYL